jgi:hypothetical protein
VVRMVVDDQHARQLRRHARHLASVAAAASRSLRTRAASPQSECDVTARGEP